MSTLFLTLSGNFWIRLLRRICKAFVPGFLSGSIQPHACCWPARALASAFPMSGMVEHRSQHGRLRLPQLEHKTRRRCAYRPDREKSQYRDGMGVWGISPEARAARNKPPSLGELWRALCPTTSAPHTQIHFHSTKKGCELMGLILIYSRTSRAIPPREQNGIPRSVRIPIPGAEQLRAPRWPCRAEWNKREQGPSCLQHTVTQLRMRRSASPGLVTQHGISQTQRSPRLHLPNAVLVLAIY